MSPRRHFASTGIPRYRPEFEESKLKVVSRFGIWLNHQKYLPATRKVYCRIAREICEFSKGKSLRAVAPLDVSEFLDHVSKPSWTHSQFRYVLTALRCFFDFLYLGGLVDTVAPRFVRGPIKITKLPRVLSQVQVRRLIESASNPRDRALLEFLYATGCRVGEAAAVKIEDIDFRHRRIQVYSKFSIQTGLLWRIRATRLEVLPWCSNKWASFS